MTVLGRTLECQKLLFWWEISDTSSCSWVCCVSLLVYTARRLGEWDESEVWNLSPTMQWHLIFSSIESILLHCLWTANFPDSMYLCSSSPLNFLLLTLHQPRLLSNLCERSIQLCRLLLPQVWLVLLLSFLPWYSIQDNSSSMPSIGVPYSRKADSRVHLCPPGISMDSTQGPGQCAAPWYAQCTSTRIRSEHMAAIYDKALKIKDFLGVVNKEDKEEGKNKTTMDNNR